METFKALLRNVPVELEPDFASAEDFKSHSIAHKILHGSFKTELSSDSSDEPVYVKPSPKIATKRKKKRKKSKAKTHNTSKRKRTANSVAEESSFSKDGVRCSALDAAQHASYVEMLCAVQQQRTAIPPQYLEMKEIVEKEQQQFLVYIKELWKTAYEKHHVLVDGAQRFTEAQWKTHLNRVKSYSQFYTSLRKIPLIYPEDKPEVQMVPLQMLLEMGVVPKLHISSDPNISTKVCTDYTKMLLLNAPCPDDANTLHHVPVSADKNAELLAVQERANIVISSSGLKCIADNISPKFDREWSIPFVVKQYSIKDGNSVKHHKVVYIDKKLPSKTMSACERNAWFHKLAIKYFMCNHRDPMSFRYPENQFNDLKVEFNNVEVQELQNNIQYDKRTLPTKEISRDDLDDSSSSTELVIDIGNEDSSSDETPTQDETMAIHTDKDASFIQNNYNYTIIPPSSKTNVTYRLWKLNSEERQKEDLKEKFLKGQSSPKELKVLVRCKMDACEHENHQVVPIHISCKLEHQAEFGAEKVSVSSLVREWVGLFFRPEAVLKRIRIDAMTEEVMMTEKIMLRDLSLTALHLHNLSIRRTVLGSLYQIMKELVTLDLGQFLLSHDVRNGPFITVLQQTNTDIDYNLYADYESANIELHRNGIPHWTPVDTNLITPKHVAKKQIPGTFQPKERKNE